MPPEPDDAGRPTEGRDPEPTAVGTPPPTLADEFGTVASAFVGVGPGEGTTHHAAPPHAFDATEFGTVAGTEAGTEAGSPDDAEGAWTEIPTEVGTEAGGTVATLAGARPEQTEIGTQAGTAAGPPGPQVAPAPRPRLPQAKLGRYVLKQFYARGGMGEVWLAEDPAIGRSVALKRMLGDRPDLWRRFRVEAQITGRLEHPGIVPVHELGAGDDGGPFYTMKFVQGRTLKKVIEEFHAGGLTGGAREVEQVRLLQMFHSLCQTVAYAHSRGVLHRDLKPENVMLGPYGETILLDWGIAKVIGQPDDPDEAGSGGGGGGGGRAPGAPTSATSWVGMSLPKTGTHAGAVMGTPSYMSPEVAAGHTGQVDQRSDIYLLGATLYEILSGRQPRSAPTAVEMIKQATHEPPKPARSVNPLVPKALDAICLKAMAYRKDDRYASAKELADDVERFIAGEPVSALREDVLTRAWRWAKRHRKGLGASAAAAAVVGLLLFAVGRVREADRKRVEATRLAERLKGEDQARRDLSEFRRLADEARFYAATAEPATENAPYYDPRKGADTASAAFALAEGWGPPSLERLAIPAERPAVREELSQLLVLAAHVAARREPGPEGARRVLALLDRAAKLAPPTAGAFGLSALAFERLGDDARKAEMRRAADDPKTPVSAQDHFLRGESERDKASLVLARATTDRMPREANLAGTDLAGTERAIREYRRALVIDPVHFWSRLQLGRSYLALGRPAEAVEAFGACVATRPGIPWGYSALGLALTLQGRDGEAEATLNRALRIAPDARPVRLQHGILCFTQKRYDDALADFAAVLAPPLDRRLTEAAYYRGQLYLQRGEVDKALADYDLAASVTPDFRSVYLDRPLIYFAKGDTPRALADLDRLIALVSPVPPGGWELHGFRGRLLRMLYAKLPLDKRQGPTGQAMLPLARDELLKAVKLGGNAPGVFDDLGAVMELSGRVDQAIAAYTRGLSLAPDDARLLVKRAWAFEQLGQHDKASADFAAASRSDPESAEAHTGLGYVSALRRLPPDAQREADLALLHGSDNYLVLHNVACIYATLSEADGPQSGPSGDVAVALLRRSAALWKADGKGPSEYELMKDEPAFKALRDRKDFQAILRDGDRPG